MDPVIDAYTARSLTGALEEHLRRHGLRRTTRRPGPDGTPVVPSHTPYAASL